MMDKDLTPEEIHENNVRIDFNRRLQTDGFLYGRVMFKASFLRNQHIAKEAERARSNPEGNIDIFIPSIFHFRKIVREDEIKKILKGQNTRDKLFDTKK